MAPKKTKGSNVRIEWNRYNVEDHELITTQKFVIDALITGSFNVIDTDYVGDSGNVEILGIYLQLNEKPSKYEILDTDEFTEDEFDDIIGDLESEYEDTFNEDLDEPESFNSEDWDL